MSDETPEDVALRRALDIGAYATPGSATLDAVRRAILDGLSVALAGQAHPRLRPLRQALADGGGATLWWSGERVDPVTAALLNGTAIHSYDFDDTHDAAIVHAMSAVLPAALAGAELSGCDGATLVSAVAAGTELACNVSLAAGHYAGWHYTTLLGGIGAALACGITLGLPEPALADAIGNAYTLAAGNKQAVLDGSLLKRVMPGFAAHTGVLAARTAASGIGGVRHWFAGQYGLANLHYEGDARPDELAGGAFPRITELSCKPVPACRFTHGAIEAATLLRDRLTAEGVDPASPHDVLVRYPALDRLALVCRPYRRRGEAEMDAQFSTAYLVAAGLVRGVVDFGSYLPDALADPVVAELAGAVRISRDLPVTDDHAIAPIEVTAAGRTVRVAEVLGSPARPMDRDQQRAKFLACFAQSGAMTGPDRPTEGDAPVRWETLCAVVDSLGDGSAGADSLIAAIRPPTAAA
ncbi:MAG TPA: MmgE/PrpD family protein [Pseudonocardiaceae bacterium]|jgi:2-methylcitrate dehydratase PrpD